MQGPPERIGYIAPEALADATETFKSAAEGGARVSCPARRAGDDRTAQGAIAVFVDFRPFRWHRITDV